MNNEYINGIIGSDSDCGELASQLEELENLIHELKNKKKGKHGKKEKKLKKKIKMLKKERNHLMLLLEMSSKENKRTQWPDVLLKTLPKAIDLGIAVVNRLPSGKAR